MDIYFAVTVQSNDEVLMALMTQYEFESFEEYDDHFIAYIKKDDLHGETLDELKSLFDQFSASYSIEEIEPQNWNAIWEASFQPVKVGQFCLIRADFHPAQPEVSYDLVINPKMAFGTGHHATTHMMIAQMEQLDMKDAHVFDFGCGTGILAILASKMGATHIDAVDIEHESYLNTLENAAINQVKNINIFEGDINVVPAAFYDVILANINRNILQKYVIDLVSKLNENGCILLSGVLVEDSDLIIETYTKVGLILNAKLEMDGWMSACFRKSNVVLGQD